jgi:hypothetical protein
MTFERIDNFSSRRYEFQLEHRYTNKIKRVSSRRQKKGSQIEKTTSPSVEIGFYSRVVLVELLGAKVSLR